MRISVSSFFVLTALVSNAASALPSELSKRFYYDEQKVRGVNLGGWFVLEPFINPSMFEWFADVGVPTPVDEYHLTQQYTALHGREATENYMKDHWATWITESDISYIASVGVNLIRIPIGYWAFQPLEGDPYVQGQEEYLQQTLQWARKYGLQAWIDLHGAPGSQNGFDNSGLRDTIQWQNGNNQQITLNVLKQIAQTYGADEWRDVVAGIELMNEPLGPALNMDTLKQFFDNGYQTVRGTGTEIATIIHDAFQPSGYWNDQMQPPQYQSVVLDHHHYQVFSAGELQRNIDQHIGAACQLGWETRSENLWRVVGEWSGALTDCTKWLNGVGRGARYAGQFDNSPYLGSCDNIDNLSAWPEWKKTDTRRYIEAQMDAYDQGGGWIFWNYKTERSVEWDFVQLVKGGLIPQPFDNRRFPNQCGF